MEAQFVGESDGLTFWLARPQDYDEIMAISHDIYGGNDYMPHRYHIWFTEPDRAIIIARRDGKLVYVGCYENVCTYNVASQILELKKHYQQGELFHFDTKNGVALESGVVVDGGKTVVVQGLRVCPSERGRGVAGVVQKMTDKYIKQLYPSVNTKRLTRGSDPGPEKLSKFIVLARRAILSLCGKAESFNSFVSGLKEKLASMEKSGEPTSTSQQLVVMKDIHELKDLLLDPDLSSRLQLPGGTIIQDWLPLEPMESNLEILRRMNLTWVVDSSSDKPTFMSFYTPLYPVPFNSEALRFNIDIYGENLSLARKALITHLELVREEIHGTVLVHIYMPQTLWEDMRKFCEGDEGVKQYREYWEQLFLEREMSL